MSFDKSVGAQAVLCSLVSVSQRYIISEWGTPVAPSSWTDAYYLILKSHLIYTVWQEEELSHSLDLTLTRFFLEAKSFTCKAIKHVTLHSGWPPHMCHGQRWHLAAEGIYKWWINYTTCYIIYLVQLFNWSIAIQCMWLQLPLRTNHNKSFKSIWLTC